MELNLAERPQHLTGPTGSDEIVMLIGYVNNSAIIVSTPGGYVASQQAPWVTAQSTTEQVGQGAPIEIEISSGWNIVSVYGLSTITILPGSQVQHEATSTPVSEIEPHSKEPVPVPPTIPHPAPEKHANIVLDLANRLWNPKYASDISCDDDGAILFEIRLTEKDQLSVGIEPNGELDAVVFRAGVGLSALPAHDFDSLITSLALWQATTQS